MGGIAGARGGGRCGGGRLAPEAGGVAKWAVAGRKCIAGLCARLFGAKRDHVQFAFAPRGTKCSKNGEN